MNHELASRRMGKTEMKALEIDALNSESSVVKIDF
jgi:hypothetical protein